LFSENNADLVLNPYYEAIIGFFFGAWSDWQRLPIKIRAQLSPRARANLMYDFVLFRAKAHFNKIPNEVDFIEKRQLFMFGVKGQVLFRFKKLDRSGKYSNIQTRQQIQLSLQRDLPGLPGKAALVVIGYQLNPLQTEIQAILVTYQNGVQDMWTYPLDDNKSDTNVVPMPTRAPRKPIVRPRRIAKKEDDKKTQ
jgi:hypothetical protein